MLNTRNTQTTLRSLLEKNTRTVLYSQGELWVTHSQSSGITAQMGSINRTFITDKSDDKNYDSIVPNILKWSKTAKPLKSKKDFKLFEIPEYPYTKMGQNYDIWGGTVKPIGKKYLLVNTSETITVINLFDTKNEALAWFKSSF
jgi:hypothetical protein